MTGEEFQLSGDRTSPENYPESPQSLRTVPNIFRIPTEPKPSSTYSLYTTAVSLLLHATKKTEVVRR